MKYKVTLKGKTYEVEVNQGEAMILDEYEAIAPTAPVAAATPAAPAAPVAAAPAPAPTAPAAVDGEKVVSPMPGTIVRVNVKAGQSIKSGEVLAVLEAMKMENEIMAPHDAKILQVLVDVGAKVDSGTPLIVLG
jgi:glutaconyl-CoA decarboxylase